MMVSDLYISEINESPNAAFEAGFLASLLSLGKREPVEMVRELGSTGGGTGLAVGVADLTGEAGDGATVSQAMAVAAEEQFATENPATAAAPRWYEDPSIDVDVTRGTQTLSYSVRQLTPAGRAQSRAGAPVGSGGSGTTAIAQDGTVPALIEPAAGPAESAPPSVPDNTAPIQILSAPDQ